MQKTVTMLPVQQVASLRRAYELMRACFGHQHWWPGETQFEICVGAILTQNTNWSNVERAIARLKAAGVFTPLQLFTMPQKRLVAMIRPAGYFNVKARRVRAFLAALCSYCPRIAARQTKRTRAVSTRDLCRECHQGSTNILPCLQKLFEGETPTVRRRLLEVHGIGPETADSMLLYAGGHLSFVVDAYTKRIFLRHGWVGKKGPGVVPQPTYDALQAICESALRHKPARELPDYWQDYHAQLVMVGKRFCRPHDPLCGNCPLNVLLPKPARQNRPKKRKT